MASFCEDYLAIRHYNQSNMVALSSSIIAIMAYITRALKFVKCSYIHYDTLDSTIWQAASTKGSEGKLVWVFLKSHFKFIDDSSTYVLFPKCWRFTSRVMVSASCCEPPSGFLTP